MDNVVVERPVMDDDTGRAAAGGGGLDLIKGLLTDAHKPNWLGHPNAPASFKRVKVRDFGGGRSEIVILESMHIPGGLINRANFKVYRGPGALVLGDEDLRRQRNLARAARRARQVVRWRAMAIGVDRLLTLTYRENMQDLQECRRHFDLFRRRMQKAGYLEHFVAVPERQQRGAWHVHIAIKGWIPVDVVRENWRAVAGDGNIDIARSRRGDFDAKRIAAYLAKYIGKAFDEVSDGRTRYWASRGAPSPVVSEHWVTNDDWLCALKLAYALALQLGAKSIDFAFSEKAGFFWMSTA